MGPNAEVTEFVIISGIDVHDYLVTVKVQLRNYLSRSFPMYRFSLVSQEGEGMGFVVVPVVGSVGSESGDMLEPDASVLFDIKMALECFDPQIAETVH